jgi:hypothetical protein
MSQMPAYKQQLTVAPLDSELDEDHFAELISELNIQESKKRYLRVRWLTNLHHIRLRELKNRWRYYRLRALTITCGAILPVLLSLEPTPALHWSSIVVSLVVAVGTGLDTFFRFGDRWKCHHITSAKLQTIGWNYICLTGPYGRFEDHEDAYETFMQETEHVFDEFASAYQVAMLHDTRHDVEGKHKEPKPALAKD